MYLLICLSGCFRAFLDFISPTFRPCLAIFHFLLFFFFRDAPIDRSVFWHDRRLANQGQIYPTPRHSHLHARCPKLPTEPKKPISCPLLLVCFNTDVNADAEQSGDRNIA